jgi:hypothetical protein
MEALRIRAEIREQQIRQHLARSDPGMQRTRGRTPRDQHENQRRPATVLQLGLYQEWEQRWHRLAGGRTATTWRAPLAPPRRPLEPMIASRNMKLPPYFSSKQRSSASTTGFTQWGYPGYSSIAHAGGVLKPYAILLLYCPQYMATRADLFHRAGSTDLQTILSTPQGAKAASRWLIACGILPHFTLAREIAQEDISRYRPLQGIDTWN